MYKGILTFHFARNYGAVLQAYALKQFLNDTLDQNFSIINYENKKFIRTYSPYPTLSNNVTSSLRSVKNSIFGFKQYLLFRAFSKQYLSINSKPFSDLSQIDGKYEYIIVGSDQVWNLSLTNNDTSYFLTNLYCKHKASYAASFGNNDQIKRLDSKLSKSLLDFDFISVREETSVAPLSQHIGRKVFSTIDPVFLLNKDVWNSLAHKPAGVAEKYICLISLKYDDSLVESCKSLKKRTGLKVYSIHPLSWKQPYGSQLYDVGPKEYIWLISNAEYIVTNSFHAVAFSIIFDRKLITRSINKNNNRISSLLSLFYGVERENWDNINIHDFNKQASSLFINKIIESKKYLQSLF